MLNRTTAAYGAGLAIVACTALAPAARAKYLPHPASVHAEALKRQATAPTLTTWNHSFVHGVRTYKWVMVGTDPAKGSATTSVPVYIIPMIFTFPDGTVLDPTKAGQKYSYTPVNLTLASPIFQNFPFTAGTVNLGTTQYIDAFQRGNFWSYVSTTAPDYHVLMGQPTVLPSITIKVTSKTAISKGPHGVKIGTVSDAMIDDAALKYIKANTTIAPNGYAIFLTYNVATPDACGYHSNVGKQAYAFVMYDDNNVCGAVDGDVDTLSHEVAEFVDDPWGNNVTPDKTHILEVGDPATAYGFYVQATSFKYTLQDLMFHDWFTCLLPSSSVSHWFDYMNKFKKNDC